MALPEQLRTEPLGFCREMPSEFSLVGGAKSQSKGFMVKTQAHADQWNACDMAGDGMQNGYNDIIVVR